MLLLLQVQQLMSARSSSRILPFGAALGPHYAYAACVARALFNKKCRVDA